MNKNLYKKALHLMLLSRFFEEKTEELFKNNLVHGTTHLANGQEASQAGLCLALKDGDWIVPTHRCHGFTICRKSSTYAMFSEMFGSKYGLAKGLGGSMHMPDKTRWNAGSSAVVGSGVPLATGIAFKLKRDGSENLSVAIFGDGATSRGSVHESMNLASVFGLPVLFFCENNLYGMSAPSSKMISVKKISDRAKAYNMKGLTVDGNSFEDVYKAVKRACSYIRTQKKPFFLEVCTYRTKGHSKNDKRLYRTAEEESFWAEKDPIKLLKKKILDLNLFSPSFIEDLEKSCASYIEDQASLALSDSKEVLSQREALSLVYAPPTLYTPSAFYTPSDCMPSCTPTALPANTEYVGTRAANTIPFDVNTEPVTVREAIRKATKDLMSKDKNVVLIGEDVGIYGGCFMVSEGLYKQFPDQVLDTPVSEEGFTGMAVGAAMMGLRPIVEIMYADFFTLIFDPIVNHAAKTHFMSGGQFSCPIVVRLPEGSGTGHGAQHTQSPEALFLNETGLKIVAPSNASDAYHLLISAVKDNNPVLFFEHKLLYSCKGVLDNKDVPIGKAKVIRKGKDITLLSYSHAVLTALKTAECLEKANIGATVIDLRTLKPFDKDTVFKSVLETGRVAFIQDPSPIGSVGSHILSVICQDKNCFKALKAEVLLIGGKCEPTPFSENLEKESIPSVEECLQRILKLF